MLVQNLPGQKEVIQFLLKFFLNVGMFGDESDREDDRVPDGVHTGYDVVHNGGFDVLSRI
jgi:hypothetical protein